MFQMILVFFFVSVFLSCLPLFHSAAYHNTSMPLCPESFSCPDLAPFNYPFYNATDTRCGLIKVHCSSKGNQIQLGNHSYPITARLWPGHEVFIRNKTFEKLVENRSCEALDYNFTSPSPLLFSVLTSSSMPVYKCTNHSNDSHTFFYQRNYYSYRCKDHNFYYRYSLKYTQLPSDLLDTCQLIQLPVKLEGNVDDTNIFSLLSWNISLSFQLSQSCSKCKERSGQCATSNQQFQCLHVNKEKGKLTLILVLAGSGFIIMMSSVIFVIWRCRKSSPFSYVSSKDKSPDVEDGGHFFGVSVFSYDELKDATQNFDPSMELGDGGFGAVYYGENFTYLPSLANIVKEQHNRVPNILYMVCIQ